MSITGLLVFLGIGKEAWTNYQSRAGFAEVTARIEDMIRTQKFEGAAADLLNASIVQRELGLGDKAELSVSGETISDEDLDARIAELVAKAGTGAADRGKGEAKGEKPARRPTGRIAKQAEFHAAGASIASGCSWPATSSARRWPAAPNGRSI